VRGHHPLIARVSEPTQPGWIAPYSRHTAVRCTGSPARFRRGNAAAGRGGAHFLAETIARVRAAGSTGALLVRADSGFYDSRFTAACRRAVVRRVRRLREAATGQPPDQQALLVPVWRHHAVLTDRIEPLLDVEREHRAHAVVEQ